MRFFMPAMLLPLSLTACGDANPVANVVDAPARTEEQAAADNGAVQAGFVPAAPAPVNVPRVDPRPVASPGAALPPASDKYRYLGRWAANPGLCADGAWRFQTRKLSTAGETSCTFETVANVPGGYDLQGTCSAEGADTLQTLRLQFDEAKRTMSVASRSLGPVTLIYCGV